MPQAGRDCKGGQKKEKQLYRFSGFGRRKNAAQAANGLHPAVMGIGHRIGHIQTLPAIGRFATAPYQGAFGAMYDFPFFYEVIGKFPVADIAADAEFHVRAIQKLILLLRTIITFRAQMQVVRISEDSYAQPDESQPLALIRKQTRQPPEWVFSGVKQRIILPHQAGFGS